MLSFRLKPRRTISSTVRIPYHVPGNTVDYLDSDLIRDAVNLMAAVLINVSYDEKIDTSLSE